ncbi:MAG: hypothetical protein KC466_01795 [Myxococcales bacterium]|nr:hypothetical protein [Myxococcales bacterium]
MTDEAFHEDIHFFLGAEREIADRAARRAGWLGPRERDVLRYALNLARLHQVRDHKDRLWGVAPSLRDYRRVLGRLLVEQAHLDRSEDDLLEHLPVLQRIVLEARTNLLAAHREHFGADALDGALARAEGAPLDTDRPADVASLFVELPRERKFRPAPGKRVPLGPRKRDRGPS